MVTNPPPPVVVGTNSLPAPWVQADVGSVTVAGTGQTNGTQFNLTASGADIWGYADAFHFVYQPFNGDGQITARVAALQNTDPWAKAGVMFRESLAPGSKYALTCVTPGKGAAFQRRLAASGPTALSFGLYAAAPHWVRLVRAGNLITSYSSPDGLTWTPGDSDTLAMPAQIYVGLALCSHNDAATNSAAFDGVALSGGASRITARASLRATTAAAFTVPPFQINPPGVADRNFSINFGAVIGQPYVIEATTNLTASWLPIFTNTAASNTFNFTTSTTNFPFRFYRARTP